MQHSFRTYISSFTFLSNQDWEQIRPCLTRHEISKGEHLLEEGKICRHLYFLESGLVRFYVWKDGLDVSKFFTQPPYTFTSQRSFTQGIPAKENIEVLEDSIVWRINRENAFRLFELASWNEFVRKLIQEVQFNTETIYEAFQNQTAEERYREMIIQGHPLLQKVPLKHLASYLGIAPQSLSRIRKKILVEVKT